MGHGEELRNAKGKQGTRRSEIKKYHLPTIQNPSSQLLPAKKLKNKKKSAKIRQGAQLFT